jgi:tetratricopeptide (TPR) repeat protein
MRRLAQKNGRKLVSKPARRTWLAHWAWQVALALLGWGCENRYLQGEQLPPLPDAGANSLAKRLVFMDKAIQQDPNEADYFYRRSTIYASLGKENLALTDIERALELNADNQDYYFVQAKLLDQANRPADALRSANQAERMGYQSPAFTWLLGKLCFLNQELSRAEQYLTASRPLVGERADTFYYLGAIKKQANDTLAATALLEQAIARQPAYPEAFTALVDMFAQQGEPKKAARYAYRATVNCPGNAAICELYGQSLMRIDEEAEAMQWYDRATKLDPARWRANHQLALYHLRKERYTLAAGYLQAALRVKPDLPQGYNTLAWLHFKYLDNYPEALRYYELAAKAAPNDAAVAGMIERTKQRIAYEEFKKTPEGQAYLARKRREAEQAAADSTAQQ